MEYLPRAGETLTHYVGIGAYFFGHVSAKGQKFRFIALSQVIVRVFKPEQNVKRPLLSASEKSFLLGLFG